MFLIGVAVSLRDALTDDRSFLSGLRDPPAESDHPKMPSVPAAFSLPENVFELQCSWPIQERLQPMFLMNGMSVSALPDACRFMESVFGSEESLRFSERLVLSGAPLVAIVPSNTAFASNFPFSSGRKANAVSALSVNVLVTPDLTAPDRMYFVGSPIWLSSKQRSVPARQYVSPFARSDGEYLMTVAAPGASFPDTGVTFTSMSLRPSVSTRSSSL